MVIKHVVVYVDIGVCFIPTKICMVIKLVCSFSVLAFLFYTYLILYGYKTLPQKDRLTPYL